MSEFTPKYSGPGKTGVCVCGCSWEDHHLMMVMNKDYIDQTGESYILGECEAFGFNEVGGMKYNEEEGAWEMHCRHYRDSGSQDAE
jgi:hypothetical protein